MKPRGTHQLIEKVLALTNTSLANGRPWKSREIHQILSEVKTVTTRQQFYFNTLDHLRDLLESADEDTIFRRLASLSLLAEPIVLAHDEAIRDHLEHVVNVWMLGWYIINATDIFVAAGSQWQPYGWDVDFRFDQLNRSWLYAALFHDCAYIAEPKHEGERVEQRLYSLLPDVYEPSTPGRILTSSIAEKMLPLWRAREDWLDERKLKSFESPSESILPRKTRQQLHKKLYTRNDHSILGSLILWREADRLEKEMQDSTRDHISELVTRLRVAAVAVACHNFYRLVKPSAASEQANKWYRLDFYYEPIAALLHLCDGVQEWSRERFDEAFLHGTGRRYWSFKSVELTELRVSDAAGLNVDLAMQQHIHEEDRPVKRRIWFEQENRIEEIRRRLVQVFQPVKNRDNPFTLRLRVQQTVDDLLCRNKLLVRWSESIPPRLLAEHLEWVQSGKESVESLREGVQEAKLTSPDGSLTLQLDPSGVSGSLLASRDAGSGFKAVILGAGATGKSTLLKHLGLAKSSESWIDQYRPFYVEELPDLPLALDSEIEAFLTKTGRGMVPLVLIDHLDRTLDGNFGAYWLSRLVELGEDRRVAVIIACRHEEYEQFAAGGLHSYYEEMRFTPELNRLTPYGPTSGTVMVNPRNLEEHFKDLEAEARTELCLLALQAGRQRSFSVPRDQIMGTLRASTGVTAQSGRDFVIATREGRVRFSHDCYQDVASAAGLAKRLCHKEQSGTNVASLVTLPPDVFRMLVGLLLHRNDGSLLTAKERHQGRLGLFTGLLKAPTVQQFLYDATRTPRAFTELTLLAQHPSLPPLARAVLEKLIGHVHYQQFNPFDLVGSADSELRAQGEASSTVYHLVAAIEYLLILRPKRKWDPQPIWVAAFVLDHLLVVLGRVYWHHTIWHKVRLLLNEHIRAIDSDRLSNRDSATAWWLHETTRKVLVIACAGHDGEDESEVKARIWKAMQALEVSLKEASTHLYDVSGERWLDVRLAHLAGHMGNFQAEQRNSSQDLEQCLEITRAKYEESVQIRDRVLRQMEGGSGCASPVEVFSTKSLGYLDVANQYRGICQAWLTKATGSGDRLAWYQFFEAFDNLDTAVQRARFELELNERYCNVFRTLLPILSLGTALKELWRVGTYAADAEEVLEYHCQNLFREYIHRGERLMRRQNDSWEVVKSQVEDPFRCWCAFHASDLPPEN